MVEGGGGSGGGEPARGRVEVIEPTRLEQTAARTVAESKATVPHLYARAEIDMSHWVSSVVSLGAAEQELAPTYADLAVWACARALRDCPRVNGAYRDGRYELYSRVNVGIVIPADNAFLVPTIHDADRKDPSEIAARARDLERRVREGAITQPDLSGGTFTVSSPAGEGLAALAPIVNRGQAAILGVGDVAARPVLRDGAVVPGHTMELVLACDHRIVSSPEAARFLARVTAALAEPPALAL